MLDGFRYSSDVGGFGGVDAPAAAVGEDVLSGAEDVDRPIGSDEPIVAEGAELSAFVDPQPQQNKVNPSTTTFHTAPSAS